jgi:4-amino-4-deoxy-L-arabinose transferase-like glycosyltransferase
MRNHAAERQQQSATFPPVFHKREWLEKLEAQLLAHCGPADRVDRMSAGMLSLSEVRHPATPLLDARGERLPNWRDPAVLGLLALVAALELLAYFLAEGYPIADAVEYMERARALVSGQRIVDAGAIRPFGFSLLLAPVFLLSDWLGITDPRSNLWAICALQMLLSLALVFVVTRIGARLGGRNCGLVAGFLLGTNPIFLEYCAMPISGIAAALCIALGIESLLERGNARRMWIGSIWLALSVLMIYQCLLVVGTIAFVILLRDRRAAWKPLSILTGALIAAVVLQVLLDKLVYGSFGASLWTYLWQKVGGLLTSACVWIGWREGAHFFYSISFSAQGDAYLGTDDLTPRSIQPPLYYFKNLPDMLVWPVLGLFVLGIARSLRRPRWKTSFLLLVFGLNLAVLTLNSSKDFRLWLPLMSCVAPLCAFGGAGAWSPLFAHHGGRNLFWRRVFTLLIAASTLAFSIRPFFSQNRREFAGYWQAMDFVNRLAEEAQASRQALAARTLSQEADPVRVVFDYNWSVYLRQSPLIELVKLPWQVNLWKSRLTTPARRAQVLSEISEADIFVVHQPVLTNAPDLFAWVNTHFQVVAAFYDQRTYEKGLGPILVLGARRFVSGEQRFFEIEERCDAERFVREQRLTRGPRWQSPEGDELLELLGWEYCALPPQNYGWITYHWYSPTGIRRPYTMLDRLTARDETNAWQNNHEPGWGMQKMEAWAPGTRVSEGYLVVPSTHPYQHGGPLRPVGGGYRRGDWLPMRLWMGIVEYDAEALARGEATIVRTLEPILSVGKDPLAALADGTFLSPDGTQWSADGLVLVGNLFLPIPDMARLPDDGRPVPP